MCRCANLHIFLIYTNQTSHFFFKINPRHLFNRNSVSLRDITNPSNHVFMKKFHLWISAIVLSSCGIIVSACSKDEPKNAECDIISAWVQGEDYAPLFFQASDMRIDNISSTTTRITFTVRSTNDMPSQIPVFFTITDGASITPGNGSMQNFKNGPVTYTVTSEDGANQRKYTVEFRQRDANLTSSYTYSFENVDSVESAASNSFYNIFFELTPGGDSNFIWASGNEGVALVHSNWSTSQFPTHSVNEGYIGKGVCLTTQDAGSLGQMFGKPIAAGNLFLGSFDLTQVLMNPLKSTVFGLPTCQEPVKISGYYKYQPGETFTDANMRTVEGRTDEANIYAVLFRNQDGNGNPINLYGDDVLTSPHVVKIAQVASLPPTDEWTRFEMEFNGPDVDATLLSAYGYSMTIVFSSSKGGDAFEGAIGSTLYIDEVEVTYKTK